MKRILIAGLGLLSGMNLSALELDVRAGYEARYTTNTDRVPIDEVEQWIHQPNGAFDLYHDTRTLSANANYNALRRIYQKDDDSNRYEDESVLAGSAAITWHAIPERLEFGVEHNRTESTISSRRTRSPDNRQEIQRATGFVSYSQPVRGRQYLRLTGSFSENEFDETSNDSEISEGRIAYIIPLSAVRNWEIYYREAQTEFKDFPLGDYDTTEAGAGFNSTAPGGSLTARMGYSITDPVASGRDEVNGVVGSLELIRGADSPIQWGITAGREIGDRSSSLDRGFVDFDGDVDLEDSGLVDIFERSSAGLSINRRFGPNSVGLNLRVVDLDYSTADQDRRSDRLTLSFLRRIRDSINFESALTYAEEDFSSVDQQDEVLFGSAGLVWDITHKLQVRTGISYRERRSDAPTNEYDEWSGQIAVSYLLFGNGSASGDR